MKRPTALEIEVVLRQLRTNYGRHYSFSAGRVAAGVECSVTTARRYLENLCRPGGGVAKYDRGRLTFYSLTDKRASEPLGGRSAAESLPGTDEASEPGGRP
jgi:hypothetical protein